MKRSIVAFVVLSSLAAPALAQTLQERLGHPADARLLVLHADDLGMAHAVNRATFEALEKGWITSASILVPCPWFPEVARWAREHPEADLGIHLALNSEWNDYRWGPVADGVPSLLDADGFLPLTQQPIVQDAKLDEVERELRAQIDRALAAGIRLTHLDTHMGTLGMSAPLSDLYRRLGEDYGLPILTQREGEAMSPGDPDALVDRVLGVAPGVPPSGWRAAYETVLEPLPPGVYELIVHLGHSDPELRGATWDHPDWGAAWRQSDYDLVRDPAFRQFLKDQGFVLVDWEDVARAR